MAAATASYGGDGNGNGRCNSKSSQGREKDAAEAHWVAHDGRRGLRSVGTRSVDVGELAGAEEEDEVGAGVAVASGLGS